MKALFLIVFLGLSSILLSQNRITGDLRNDERKIEKDIDYVIKYKDEGRITVDIVVDIDGDVTSAVINSSHTTIKSTPMQMEAKNRAKKMVFERCYHCPKFHRGSIVYKVEEN